MSWLHAHKGTIAIVAMGVAMFGVERMKRTAQEQKLVQKLDELRQAQRELREEQESLRVQQLRTAYPLVRIERTVAAEPRAAAPVGNPATSASPSAPPPAPPSSEELHAHLERWFSSDPAEASWGARVQPEVRAGLERTLPEGSRLESIHCGGSACRIETSHRSAEEYQAFMERGFSGQAGGPWNGAVASSLVHASGGELLAVSFLAREGTSFPKWNR